MIANSVLESRAIAAKGAAALGGSNATLRAAKTVTNRSRMVLAPGQTADNDNERSRSGRDLIVGGAARTASRHSDETKPKALGAVGCEFIPIDAMGEQAAALDYKGRQVIFVLLVPKGASDHRLQELMVHPTRFASRDESRALMEAAALQVDLPPAVRLSAVRDEILAGIARASLEPAPKHEMQRPVEPTASLPNLTRREREVLQMILEGHPNKNIAADLRISMRTVENHRAKVMKKTGSKSLPALVRLAIAAGAMPDASPR